MIWDIVEFVARLIFGVVVLLPAFIGLCLTVDLLFRGGNVHSTENGGYVITVNGRKPSNKDSSLHA